VKVTVHVETGAAYAPFIRRHLKGASALLASRGMGAKSMLRLDELSVALVGDRRMSRLHQEFMNIAGPTDVLTFPIDFAVDGRVSSGEVYICVPEARRQARKSRVGVKLELLLYAIHGMLHLLGYDDRTRRAYCAMHEMEDAILTRLGLGPVFARQPGGQNKPVAQRPPRKGGRA